MDDCARAQTTYETYIEALEAGEVISPEQIRLAKLAAVVLTASCTWIVATRSEVLTREDGTRVGVVVNAPIYDRYGVPKLVRPDAR